MKMRTRRTMAVVLPATLALAMLAACNGQTRTAPTEQVVNLSTMAQEGQANSLLAKRLGMGKADAFVQKTQLQVKSTTGTPLAGAVVVMGTHRLVTDERGVIDLPEELRANERIAAAIDVPGHVSMVMDVVPGSAAELAPVDSKRTPITAAGGGTAINSEGNLQVVFPPGSITGDAQVAVTRQFGQWGLPGQRLPEQMPFTVTAFKDKLDGVDLSDMGYKLADNVPIGTYDYHFDLGEGVKVAPGAEIFVKFKAEGRMLEMVKAHAENGDNFEGNPEQISRDADGNYWLTMRVVGPQAAPADAGAAKQRRLMSAVCNTYTDQQENRFQVKKQWSSLRPGIEVPIWNNGYRTSNNISANWMNEYSPTAGGVCVSWQSAYQYEFNGWNMQRGSSIPGWITVMTHRGDRNGGRCIYYQFDPEQYYCDGGKIYVRDPGYEWQVTYTNWVSKTINAVVTWLSDDSRIQGVVPNARVDFNHSLTPMRNNVAMSVYTGGNGYASTVGANNSYGSAVASLPSQAGFTYGTSGTYYVDCRTVALNIVKMMPRVSVRGNVRGEHSGALTVPTNRGNYTLASAAGSQIKPIIDTGVASQSFQIDGTFQPNSNTWVDVASGAINVGWNGSHTLPTDIWISKPIGVSLTYASDDNSPGLPDDQKPTSRWNGAPVSGANVTFSHPQSAYGRKTRQEPLSFQNVSSASTWGISGADSSISASRSANGVTLAGSGTGKVDGRTVAVAIGANLPVVNFSINGVLAAEYVMDYKLTDAAGNVKTGKMTIKPSAGQVTVRMPVEDPVGTPGKHTLTIERIMTSDFQHTLTLQDGSPTFPPLAGLHRGGTFTYSSTFKSDFVGAK